LVSPPLQNAPEKALEYRTNDETIFYRREETVLMAYIQGEGRSQGTLFPVVLDDLVASAHMCRVIDAFVEQLDLDKLGFGRAHPAETGRPATIRAPY
jgi:hypothetical protein